MEGECPICYEGLEHYPSSKLITCSHEFHIDCIHKWLKIRSSCPVCRAPLESNFLAKQKFFKNIYKDCNISFDQEKVLKINYDNKYKAAIPYNKIKSIYIDKKGTKIVYNNSKRIDTLSFKIPNAYYFLECFRSKVMA